MTVLRIRAWPVSQDPGTAVVAEIELLDHAGFAARTLVPAPGRLDPDAAYKGHRLP